MAWEIDTRDKITRQRALTVWETMVETETAHVVQPYRPNRL